MAEISFLDLQEKLKHFCDLAVKEPVLVSDNGQESIVLLSIGAYKRLKSFDDREALYAWELPDYIIAELEKPFPSYKTDIDHLMEDDGNAPFTEVEKEEIREQMEAHRHTIEELAKR